MKSQSEAQITEVEQLQERIQSLESELLELQIQRESDAETAEKTKDRHGAEVGKKDEIISTLKFRLEEQKNALEEKSALLDKGALSDAVNLAHECVALNKMDVRGFLLLTEAFFRQKRHEDAVAWYKTGLEIHPDNEELLKGLKKARVAVLNELSEQSDDYDEEVLNNGECINHKCVESADIKQSEGAKNSSLLSVQSAKHIHTHADSNEILIIKSENSATQDLVFQANMERVLKFLDVMKLARLTAVYACSELLSTVMLISMLVKDVRLICVVFMVTAVLLANSLRTISGEHAKLWDEGRRLKLDVYVTAIMYWVVWRGEWTDTLKTAWTCIY
ncbi:hypothetical protein PsorP6_010451 [Peronosclerospora sorghi]|uniref:Uncharacterized protein n=1 Tax=Peronosclerospora sorghi TaxID=230839 RepID=A0ACC0VU25_9STRA|nr:hypothetical protein PsorP6_010451 [Peronosclerospora sorghi]